MHGHMNVKYEIIVCLLYCCQCLRQKTTELAVAQLCFCCFFPSSVVYSNTGFYFIVASSTVFMMIPKTFMNRPFREELLCQDGDRTDALQVNWTWGDLTVFHSSGIWFCVRGYLYRAFSGNVLILLDILTLEDENTTLSRKPVSVYPVLHHHNSRKTGTSSSRLGKSKN